MNRTSPLTIACQLAEAAAVLAAAGIESSRLDAEVLLAGVLGMDRARLFLNPRRELSPAEEQRFRRRVERRRHHEPVAYIVGEKEFWSLPFRVNRHVLIPRPDTEILVEEALRILAAYGGKTPRILEIGVGSGAVSIALAATQGHIRITATDISAAAVAVARENALRNGVAARMEFAVCSLFAGISAAYDMIVANPPYIADGEFELLPAEVRRFEPPGALRGGPDGMDFHREIIAGAAGHLQPGGALALEIGAGQREMVAELLRDAAAYDNVICRKDYAGRDRVILARRI